MNIWAIVVSVVAAMVLGFLWYGPLFGKAWMRGMGWDPNNKELMDKMKKGAGPGYFVMLIGALLTAIVISYLAMHTNLMGLTALCVALLGWVGFVLPVRLGDKMFEKRNTHVVLISLGFQLVNLVVMGLIIGYWK